nr:MAG TPA: hypothetical protein [Caudoviricetes sp.]
MPSFGTTCWFFPMLNKPPFLIQYLSPLSYIRL